MVTIPQVFHLHTYLGMELCGNFNSDYPRLHPFLINWTRGLLNYFEEYIWSFTLNFQQTDVDATKTMAV